MALCRARGGGEVVLPTDHVAQHVELAYATTAYRAQGRTTATAHAIVSISPRTSDPDMARALDERAEALVTPLTDGPSCGDYRQARIAGFARASVGTGSAEAESGDGIGTGAACGVARVSTTGRMSCTSLWHPTSPVPAAAPNAAATVITQPVVGGGPDSSPEAPASTYPRVRSNRRLKRWLRELGRSG